MTSDEQRRMEKLEKESKKLRQDASEIINKIEAAGFKKDLQEMNDLHKKISQLKEIRIKMNQADVEKLRETDAKIVELDVARDRLMPNLLDYFALMEELNAIKKRLEVITDEEDNLRYNKFQITQVIEKSEKENENIIQQIREQEKALSDIDNERRRAMAQGLAGVAWAVYEVRKNRFR